MTDRVPPGQTATERWPVLHQGPIPDTDLSRWELAFGGDAAAPFALSWGDVQTLPRVAVTADFHCVTRWSVMGQRWEGVALAPLIGRLQPAPGAVHALVGAENDYTTSLPLAELLREDVLLAYRVNGADLPPAHGGPLRLVVPRLYAWKSAKWVRRVEVLAAEQLGYWEARGYARLGDPWTEDRMA